MGKEIANRIIAILMVCCPTILVGCSSDEDVFESTFITAPNVDESIALAMAAGSYECAFELDTVKCYYVENDIIEELDILGFYGSPLPRQGDYFEIKGNKAYCIMKISGWWSMLKSELDEYMESKSEDAYDSNIYKKIKFSYNIIDSSLYEDNFSKYVVVLANDSQIVIRHTYGNYGDGQVIYKDYYYSKTAPRDVINSYDSYKEATDAIESCYREVFGEDKFKEMGEEYGWLRH